MLNTFLRLAVTMLGSAATPPNVAPVAARAKAVGQVPIYFEPNLGQWDPQIRFVARGAKQRGS